MWRPEITPGSLILGPAPAGFEDLPIIDPNAIGKAFADRRDRDGRQLLIHDGDHELYICLPPDDAPCRTFILLPDTVHGIRSEIASRAVRRLHGETISLLPRALLLTSLQKIRLIHLLHAFDVHNDGGSARDVATTVLADDQARLPGIEWKDSAARRKATLLIRDAVAFVNRGYLKLLRGR
jgi:hypothetical protein